ncbi:Global nitrogen regulator [Posidoniimonas polymericola]|uniref:Global nitrogen regulator n=1 Tax=Posidoniimonas polymericola TaxID=2528002 RepID=A0A5C5YR93_9BACT|nr:Crp/Fnr family transcriptional regulator [Posidoniimonas polymericola]TWT77348.1 Global nitrogen regulator [Posidoniimonas polymericola]
MTESLWWLKQSEIFRRLSAEQLARLEAQSTRRSFAPRSPLLLPSEATDNVFLLTEGLLKVAHVTGDGRETILGYIEPGELFGELAILNDADRDDYVEAVERSSVVALPAAEIRTLMSEHADMAVAITRLVGMRRQRIERRLRNLLFRSNRERLLHLLLDLAEQFGVPSDQGVELRVRLSHQDLAGLIGSTRESVTVLMGELRAAGDIGGGRRRVVLLNPCSIARSVGREKIRLPERGLSERKPLLPCLDRASS